MNIRCTPSNLSGEINLSSNDFSNVILLCAGALSKDGVTLRNLSFDDVGKKISDTLQYMGADIKTGENFITVSENRLFGMMSYLRGENEFFSLYCALASVCDKGFTQLSGIKSLDQSLVSNVIENLSKIRVATAFDDEDELIIWGDNDIVGGTVDAKNNPYFALAFALISCRSRLPIDIHNIGDLQDRFPNFIENFNELGGKIEIIK